MERKKHVHLQVEKNDKKIIYTIYDMHGALKVTTKKEHLKHYINIFNLKIIDIIHTNYNCDYANIPF